MSGIFFIIVSLINVCYTIIKSKEKVGYNVANKYSDDIEEINVSLDEYDDFPKTIDVPDISRDDDESVEDIDEETIDYGSYYEDEEKKEKKHNSIKGGNRLMGVLIAIIAVLIVAIGIVLFVIIKSPNKTKADLYDYFGVSDDEIRLVYDGELTDYSVLTVDGFYYIEKEFYDSYLTDKFYRDVNKNVLLYTTATDVMVIPFEGASYTAAGVTESTSYVISFVKDEKVYISIDFVTNKAAFTYFVYEKPNRVAIVPDKDGREVVELEKKATVRTRASIKGQIIDSSQSIWIANSDKDSKWIKISSYDGLTGYVKKDEVEDIVPSTLKSDYIPEIYENQLRDYDIVMVWDGIDNMDENAYITDRLNKTSGVTTVSPAWYELTDVSGNINSYALQEYVDIVHSKGMEIWPLISDFRSTYAGMEWNEKDTLSNSDYRKNIIDRLMSDAATFGYDGINVDFEKVPKDAGEDYIQFIRELSIECRKRKLVLSVDNYVPMAHTAHYNRKAQGECVDYVIVMGYDEHYAGGQIAGSVASKVFVANGIDNTLLSVPKEKVINGIPFYTRMWMQTKDADGKAVLDSKVMGMDEALSQIDELGLEKSWSDFDGQYVAKGVKDGVEYSIWLEEDESMAVKMSIVRQREIAGVAAWNLGDEKESIWNVITK